MVRALHEYDNDSAAALSDVAGGARTIRIRTYGKPELENFSNWMKLSLLGLAALLRRRTVFCKDPESSRPMPAERSKK